MRKDKTMKRDPSDGQVYTLRKMLDRYKGRCKTKEILACWNHFCTPLKWRVKGKVERKVEPFAIQIIKLNGDAHVVNDLRLSDSLVDLWTKASSATGIPQPELKLIHDDVELVVSAKETLGQAGLDASCTLTALRYSIPMGSIPFLKKVYRGNDQVKKDAEKLPSDIRMEFVGDAPCMEKFFEEEGRYTMFCQMPDKEEPTRFDLAFNPSGKSMLMFEDSKTWMFEGSLFHVWKRSWTGDAVCDYRVCFPEQANCDSTWLS